MGRMALAALASVFLTCGKFAIAPPVQWSSDLGAVERARQQHKFVLLWFDATWDMAGKELEQATFTDPDVRALLATDFVNVYVDGSDDEAPAFQEAARKYRCIGVPTLLVLGPVHGEERLRINEFLPPKKLAAALRYAKL
jgi:thiol:disulfide interchange protein